MRIFPHLVEAMIKKARRYFFEWETTWTTTSLEDPVAAMELLGAFDRLSEEMNRFSREIDAIVRRAQKRQRAA